MSTSGETLRTFVAIQLPEDVLAAIARARRALDARLASRALRWTRPDGIHLTLKFLGETPADVIPEVERRLGEALAGVSSFALELAPLGVFPSPAAARVVWVGLAGDLQALADAQRRVEEAISPLGYPTEKRPFSPHLTLARVADFAAPADRREIGSAVSAAPVPPRLRFEVQAVSLMRSQLGPGGARYTQLFSVALA